MVRLAFCTEESEKISVGDGSPHDVVYNEAIYTTLVLSTDEAAIVGNIQATDRQVLHFAVKNNGQDNRSETSSKCVCNLKYFT